MRKRERGGGRGRERGGDKSESSSSSSSLSFFWLISLSLPLPLSPSLSLSLPKRKTKKEQKQTHPPPRLPRLQVRGDQPLAHDRLEDLCQDALVVVERVLLEQVPGDDGVRDDDEGLGPERELEDAAVVEEPLVEGLEEGLVPGEVRELARRRRDVLAADVGLEVALRDERQRLGQPVADVALPEDGRPDQEEGSGGEEEGEGEGALGEGRGASRSRRERRRRTRRGRWERRSNRGDEAS